MKYIIKAHPTKYNGVQFRSRLEARWAAFFDLAGWTWEYEPIDLDGWVPDFKVTFPCPIGPACVSHLREHVLYAEVKPHKLFPESEHEDRSAWDGHPVLAMWDSHEARNTPHPAAFGPGVDWRHTHWIMRCGRPEDDTANGFFLFCVDQIVPNAKELWKAAGNTVQWLAKKQK